MNMMNSFEHVPSKVSKEQRIDDLVIFNEMRKPFIENETLIPEIKPLLMRLEEIRAELKAVPVEQLTDDHFLEGEAIRQRIEDLIIEYLYGGSIAA